MIFEFYFTPTHVFYFGGFWRTGAWCSKFPEKSNTVTSSVTPQNSELKLILFFLIFCEFPLSVPRPRNDKRDERVSLIYWTDGSCI